MPLPPLRRSLRSSSFLIPFLLLFLFLTPADSQSADDEVRSATTERAQNSTEGEAMAPNEGSEDTIAKSNNSRTEEGGEAEGQRALAAPIRRGQENAVEVNGERKPFFKIHYRDGIQKAIFDETQRRIPADFEDTNDVTGGDPDTYDDGRLVEPRFERPLFIPEIYRNETQEESSTKGPGKTQRPLVAPELQSRQPITVRTTTPRSPSIRPAQPFARPGPGSRISPPSRPPQGIPPPRQPPQPFRPPFPSPQQARPPQLPRPAPFLPPSAQPQQQQGPSAGGLGADQLRSGVCHHSIFYTPQAVSEFDLQRIYTHFAVVVSIDQCARTCHEFNCDVAIMDPVSRHCQFNPSTAFRLHKSCPQWPNPLYRNNVQIGQDPVRIACVTCQQRRRGSRPGQQQSVPMPFNGQGRQQQQTFSIRRPFNQQPQPNVIRTTGRDRIDADSGLLRIANAAPLREENGGGGTGGDLSAELTKLEGLLKSAEDYLDETEEQQSARRAAGERGGRAVQSWREGHPQGEGFSPLRINPLRRPFMADLTKSRAVFLSTDTLSRKEPNGEDEFRRRRTQRESGRQMI